MVWFAVFFLAAFFAYRYLYPQKQLLQNEQTTTNHEVKHISPVPVPKTTTFSPRDQIAGTFESVNWCNHIARICWPQIGKILEAQLSPTLEPLINLYLPKPFSKFRFVNARLGKDPMTIDRVTVHRRYHDSIAMDLDVTYRGHPSIGMKCAPLSAGFGIKELRWSGRLSVLLRPLLTTLPLIGAIQAAMITHPEMEMDFTGVANIAEFGPVERIVKMVLRNVISSVLVLPNRLLYKLSNSVDYFNVYQPPVGIIDITIERGRRFTKEKKIGMIKAVPDLYCVATFALEELRTEVQMNNLNPEWIISKSFILSDLDQPFHLECYDKDTITRDDLVGSVTINAQELLEKKGHWYSLEDNIDKKIAKEGQIYIKAQLSRFREPGHSVLGSCVISILVDRANNLPPNTKAAACRVILNHAGRRIVRETPQIRQLKRPTPYIDPSNPIWNFSFDILCDDFSNSDVTLEIMDGKHIIGSTVIHAAELDANHSNVKEGGFIIGGGSTLRAKVIHRALEPSSFPPKSF